MSTDKTTTTGQGADRSQRAWWMGDPNVDLCTLCACPIQGGIMAMSKHKQVVHPIHRSLHRPKVTR